MKKRYLLLLLFVIVRYITCLSQTSTIQHIGDFYYYNDSYAESYSPNDYRFPLRVSFRLHKKMGVEISHCGSYGLSHTTMIVGSHNIYTDCSYKKNHKQANLVLEPGLYYIISEGTPYEEEAELDISFRTYKPKASINGKTNPVNVGNLYADDIKTYTKNSYNYTDSYTGSDNTLAGDIYYKFSLKEEVTLVVSNSPEGKIHTYLLNSGYGLIHKALGTKLTYKLKSGTYYVVVENGDEEDGEIQTVIETLDSNYVPYENENQVAFPTGTSGRNYMQTAVLKTPTSGKGNVNLTTANSMIQVDYLDELGRLSQTVLKGITPQSADLVSLIEYDEIGRNVRNWTPAAVSGNNGGYVSKSVLESNYSDKQPYEQIFYEDSPLSRMVKQLGPGEDWHRNDKGKVTGYGVNTLSGPYHLYHYEIDDWDVNIRGIYKAGKVYVTEYTDEDGNKSYEFTDIYGKLLLSRTVNNSEYHDTYFLYREDGKLSYVFSPIVSDSEEVKIQGMYIPNFSNGILADYGYYYGYDDRGNCSSKSMPGTGSACIYDQSNRLILKRTRNQREENLWTLYTYDPLGRLAYTGEITLTESHWELSNKWKNKTLIERFSGNSSTKMRDTGYSCDNFSSLDIRLLSVNYYDNYQFLDYLPAEHKTELSYKKKNGFDERYQESKGLLTGTRIYGSQSEVSNTVTVYYYDERDNEVQVLSTNYIGGYDKHYYARNFFGSITKHAHQHIKDKKEVFTETYNYTYDHAERLIKTTHMIEPVSSKDKARNITLLQNQYNELGLLATKKLHGEKEKINYKYNVRGWLVSLNSDNYIQAFSYKPYYNGNIRGIGWRDKKENLNRTYVFKYDQMNRLIDAQYREESIANQAYRLSIGAYDKHGNIQRLSRYGKAGDFSVSNSGMVETSNNANQTGKLIDDLFLSYKGNQLIKVEDRAKYDPIHKGAMHFVDGVDKEVEYTYDKNGNMIADLNKGINRIHYNFLNQPTRVDFNANKGGRINYYYDALGNKYSTQYFSRIPNTNIYQFGTKVDYCGNIIYRDGKIDKILTPEGYITQTGSEGFKYHYYIRDHLGNNRVVINETGAVEEVNHYYPFGSLFEDQGFQSYKYNGKELDRMRGLDWYDYSARTYDPVLSRFTSIDPLADKYYAWSPYVYCLNNPIRFIDPDGRDVWEVDEDGYINWVEESEEHILYSLNADGIRSNQSIRVQNRDILDQLSRGRGDYKGYYAITKKSEVGNIFTFVANNTKVEWGISKFKNGEYIVHTSNKTTNVASATSINGYNENDLVFKVHSHPGIDAPKGASESSAQRSDMTNIKEMAHRFNNAGNYANFPKHFVYHPESETLYQYTPYTSSINVGKVSGSNSLLYRIKNSKSPFYGY